MARCVTQFSSLCISSLQLCILALMPACQPLDDTDRATPAPEAPQPQQVSPGLSSQPGSTETSPPPQCDDIKIKCAPPGGFPPALVNACKAKYQNADLTICDQSNWPMSVYTELNNSVAPNSNECLTMFVSGTKTGLKLREQPSTTAADLGGANEGEDVCAISNAGSDWAMVRYKGKTGYMNRQFLVARASASVVPASANTTPSTATNNGNAAAEPSSSTLKMNASAPPAVGRAASTGTKAASPAAANFIRNCSKFKTATACKVTKSNRNCWLKDPKRRYNGLPVVDDDLTMVTTGQVHCYADTPETVRVAWGPIFMHRPALMRWSPELMCYVENSDLLCL